MHRYLSLTVALCLLVANARADERPNIIVILSDDQRYDTIHALGNDEIQTPHLDALVNRGTTFTHTYIQGSTQPAVCVCSRACLLSGRTLYRAPVNLQGTTPLPAVLHSSGMKTFGIGKWHNGPASYARAFEDGAAAFFGGMHDHNRIPVHPFDKTGKYAKSNQQIGDGFSTELFADKAVAFLKNYRDEAPYFLYVALTAPHDPRTPPGKYKTMYDPAKLSLPPSFLPQHPFDNGEMTVRDEQLAPWPRTERVIKQHLADYYGMISHLDEQVGRILAALEESGKSKNTLVIFASDNGLAVGRHGLLGKQSLYDHSLRVPLVIAGPNLPANKRSDALVCLFDLFPTLCELAGAKLPDKVEGLSLLPLLRGETVQGRPEIFAAYRDAQRMLRDDRYKLIRYPQINRSQLFDLKDDPTELRDLSALPEHAPRVRDMLDRLAKQQTIHGDKLPLTSKNPRPEAISLPPAQGR